MVEEDSPTLGRITAGLNEYDLPREWEKKGKKVARLSKAIAVNGKSMMRAAQQISIRPVKDPRQPRQDLTKNNVLWDILNETGVRGTSKETPKHVPSWLVTETFAVRQAFIAGWLDADGDSNPASPANSTVYANVRDGMVALGRSLGSRSSISAHAIPNTPSVPNRRQPYSIIFSGDNAALFTSRCCLPRKKATNPIISRTD